MTKTTIAPDEGLLGLPGEQMWAACVARYPRYRDRFARRSAVMYSLADRIIAAARGGIARTCPCGSGKKYKKCCGAA
jgi:hypothetical protein